MKKYINMNMHIVPMFSRVFYSSFSRFFSFTRCLSKFSFYKPGKANVFVYEGVEYCRVFGKWKCNGCKNKWTSAYTWISLKLALDNKITLKYKKDDKDVIMFSGEEFKDSNLLLQNCKSCKDKSESVLRGYINLERKVSDNYIPHSEHLCIKCLKGYKCSKRSFSTCNNLELGFNKRYYSTINNVYNGSFIVSDSFELRNFYSSINTLSIPSLEFPYCNNEWEDYIIHKNKDLYNFMYKDFFSLYSFIIDLYDLKSYRDFDTIYLGFYKKEPDFDGYKTDETVVNIDKDSVLYFKEISVEFIEELRDYFINGYKDNMFDELQDFLEEFIDKIIMDLTEDLDYSGSVYVNMVVPRKITSPSINSLGFKDRKYYSTLSGDVSSIQNKSILTNIILNNPLILSGNTFGDKILMNKYRFNNKLIYVNRCYSTKEDNLLDVTPNNIDGFYDSVFIGISKILENNPINNETQIKIEKYLRNQYLELNDNKEKPLVLGIDSTMFSKEFNEKMFELIEEIKEYLNIRKNLVVKKEYKSVRLYKKDKYIYDYFIKDILLRLNINELCNVILFVFFKIITYNNTSTSNESEDYYEFEGSSFTLNITLLIGQLIRDSYVKTLQNEYNLQALENEGLYKSFKDFKEILIKGEDGINGILFSTDFIAYLGGYFLDIMFACNMCKIKIKNMDTKKVNIVVLTEEILNLVGSSVNRGLYVPMHLPMIVEPKEFGENVDGGYLLNGIDYLESLISSKITYSKISKIKVQGYIYNSINRMMKTPFQINKTLLDYLINNRDKHKLLINLNSKSEYDNIKRNKYQEREYQKHMATKILEEYVLKIALTYSNVPEIYFPLKLDNRGRLYPIPVYLNFQGSELAKSLLQFAAGDVITRDDKEAINHLKCYGATCFGNGLDKKSYDKRLQWIETNWDRIIDFENSGIVYEAENKFLFLAFCFEIIRFNNYFNNEYIHEFKTRLPIQLDGTCNGFQHLAMLSNEIALFESLNLSNSKKNKDPKDFYQHILDQVNIDFEMKISQNNINDDLKETYERLLAIGLNRSVIKPAIMNKPYNATVRTLVKYIKDSLEYVKSDTITIFNKDLNKDVTYNRGWYSINKNSDVLVNHKDVEILVKTIEEIIYIKYPKIKSLHSYLTNIVKILNKLNLPILWTLPHGLEISQNYLQKKSKKIYPFTHIKTSLSITTTIKNSIDKNKQITAFMPNLVHSLDASSLILLYDSFYKTIKSDSHNNVNFYSVHDCYGITVKNIELLISLLRSVYIKLYSEDAYILTFDKEIIDFILKSYGLNDSNLDKDKRIITIKDIKYKLPDLPFTISNKKEIYENISKSLYLIK